MCPHHTCVFCRTERYSDFVNPCSKRSLAGKHSTYPRETSTDDVMFSVRKWSLGRIRETTCCWKIDTFLVTPSGCLDQVHAGWITSTYDFWKALVHADAPGGVQQSRTYASIFFAHVRILGAAKTDRFVCALFRVFFETFQHIPSYIACV